MATEERIAVLQQLLEDEAFVEALKNAEKFADFQAIFAARGVTITEDDLKEIAKMANTEGELDETNLDDVAGGLIRPLGTTLIPSTSTQVLLKKTVKKIAKKISSLFK